MSFSRYDSPPVSYTHLIESLSASISSSGMAILDEYTKSSSDDYYMATLYTADGHIIVEEVDTSEIKMIDNEGLVGNIGSILTGAQIDTYLKAKVYYNRESGEKEPIWDRVVEYNISEVTGRINSLSFAAIQREAVDEYFRQNFNALGSLRMDDDTVVIDAIEYMEIWDDIPTCSDLYLTSVDGFVDSKPYTAYAYGKRNINGAYPFVIVVSAAGIYTDSTNFAIVADTPKLNEEDGTTYTLEVLYQGREYSGSDGFIISNDIDINGADNITALSRGDVIVRCV